MNIKNIKNNTLLVLLSLFGWTCISIDQGEFNVRTLIVCLFLVYATDLFVSKFLGKNLHDPLTDDDWDQ